MADTVNNNNLGTEKQNKTCRLVDGADWSEKEKKKQF